MSYYNILEAGGNVSRLWISYRGGKEGANVGKNKWVNPNESWLYEAIMMMAAHGI